VSHVLPVDTKVIAYFDTPLTPVFLLDDPVKGKLDDPTYVLSGDIATDISDDVTSVRVKRGRSRWLDSINAGTASFAVNNLTREFDPLGAGTYSANIVPGKRVTIEVGETPIFDGTIDDWDLKYTLGGYSSAKAVVSDSLSELSRQLLSGHTASAQLSGARVDAVLDRAEIDFPAGSRNIDTGVATLQADVVPDATNALDYLKIVAETESGRLFAAADGVLTFQQRSTPVPTIGTPLFADDGSGIPFDDIMVQVGSELLFNRASVLRSGGTVQIDDNTASQALYGIRTTSTTGLLFDSDADALGLAEFIVHKYGDPAPRFAEIGVNIAALTVAQAIEVASLDLGALVQVRFAPPGGGSPIDQYGVVEAIEHRVGVDRHAVSFSLSSLAGVPFVLDDAVLGELDGESTLAY
jgi:hypothetical protein